MFISHSSSSIDWRVAGGLVTGTDSFAAFQAIMGNATIIDTGFIVLQHDLFQITVDLATGYTLNAALSHNPPFNLRSIGQCSKIATANLYLESNTNKTFPYTNHTSDDSKSNTALANTIPILSTFFGVGLAVLCSILYGFN
jgi:hypothetical protein